MTEHETAWKLLIANLDLQYKSKVRPNYAVSVLQRRVKQSRRPQTPCRSSRWTPTARWPPQTLQQKPQSPLPSQLLTTEEHRTVSDRLLQNTSLHHRQRANRQRDWKPDKDWSSRRRGPIFIIDLRLSQRQGDTKAYEEGLCHSAHLFVIFIC